MSATRSLYPHAHWVRFGAWIRQHRRARDLTQVEVATKAGIHENQIARIEKGESGTKRETVLLLADAIGINRELALNKAGFAIVDSFPDTPPKPEPPKNLAEFVKALEDMGVPITAKGDLETADPDELQELIERISADVNITIRRKQK